MAGRSAGMALRGLRVRPVVEASERAAWDGLMEAHHQLGFRSPFGAALRHAAELPDGEWAALLGWSAGSFKVGARDRWLGWAPEQQFRRLHLIACNTRFLVLPGHRVANLASRALGLSLRRLSSDMEALRGHPVLLAETFVDPSRFKGTCYRAAGWTVVGETRGFARASGGWREHGRPKAVWVRPLRRGAAEALGGLEEPASWRCGEAEPPKAARLGSLYGFLREVPEFRKPRGVRHRLATVLAIALAGKLAGVRGVMALGEFAGRLTQAQLAAARAFRSPRTGRLEAPSASSFHRILSALDPEALDRALRRWAASRQGPGGALALDGKAASEWVGGPNPERVLVAAVAHGSGLTLGQTASDGAGGEILGVRRLLRGLPVAGRVLTMDALHSCPETARLVLDLGADYAMPLKENRKTLLEDVKLLDWDSAAEFATFEKGHGRIETRRCRAVPLDGAPDGLASLPGRRQAFRVVRERHAVRTRKTTVQTVFGLASLGPERAGPAELLALNRGHWEIENRLHHVRDVTCDEDRVRIRAGRLASNLAGLANAAVSIVRLKGRFAHLPQANRHYAARQGEALREVVRPG